MTPSQLANRAAWLMENRRARDVRILDLRGLSPVADFFVIGSGSSSTQIRAIADYVAAELDVSGVRRHHIEGYDQGRWILIDYLDVVVHIFQDEHREFYNLERLWGDAPVLAVTPGV